MTSLTNFDKLFPQNLTERAVAQGMPSSEEGNYEEDYQRIKNLYCWESYRWSVEDWKKHLKLIHEAKHGFADRKTPGGSAAIDDMVSAAYTREETRHEKSVAREKLQKELGAREFTLTYSPAWYSDDKDAQHAMEVAIERLTRYYKDEIIEFHAVGEYTKAGCSHVHGYYLLDGGKKITDKNFKRAWSHWDPKKKYNRGFQGGHHETIKRISDFAGYTEKHLEEAWLDIHITNAANEESTSDETRGEEDERTTPA